VLFKNLHQIRLLRRRLCPSFGRHGQKLEKACKAPETNSKIKKNIQWKNKESFGCAPATNQDIALNCRQNMRNDQLSQKKAYHIVLRGYRAWVLLIICQHHDVLTPVTVFL
jgi:hypothetical protein